MSATTDAISRKAGAAARGRNTAIDSLRTAMMCVVMFGHPLLPYMTVPRRFEDPQTHVGFDVAGVFLYGFAMPAFFVTAGFAAAGLFARRGARAFWRNRATRIFAPLLVGYLLLTPLTRAAYEFGQAVAASGSLAAGWQVFGEARWLRWGKVYHLWFLASLLVFSAGAIALDAAARGLPQGVRTKLDTLARSITLGRARMPLLVAAVAALMVPSWTWGTGQGTDGWMQTAIFGFFALGWLLYRYRDGLTSFSVNWWHGPALALAVMPLCAWATIRRLFTEDTVDVATGLIAGTTNAIVAVGMTLGLLGLFQLRYAERGRLGQYVSEASYWIYLIHYPVVIAAGAIMAAAPWPALAKYLATVALSLPIIIGSYELLVRNSPLGAVLGGPRKRKPAGRIER